MTNPKTLKFPDGSEMEVQPGDVPCCEPSHPDCYCGHPRSPHHELGDGKCDLVTDGEMCPCSSYRPAERGCGADRDEKGKPRAIRIRYMELPSEIIPETDNLTTPFAIIFDRIPEELLPKVMESFGKNAEGGRLADAIGARATLFFTEEVQIGDDY